MSEISVNKILVTGGAGYIGSHTCVELLNAGYQVVVYDNFSNSHPEALKRVEQIAGKKVELVKGDIRDQTLLEKTLKEHQCEAVIHFAGLKAVGESELNSMTADFHSNEYTKTDLAKKYKISRASLYRLASIPNVGLDSDFEGIRI